MTGCYTTMCFRKPGTACTTSHVMFTTDVSGRCMSAPHGLLFSSLGSQVLTETMKALVFTFKSPLDLVKGIDVFLHQGFFLNKLSTQG